ncbi:MAG: molybdenum cofactor guanylyltransferase [Firmicutes bacterium]|jgi:molybdopterin-guanine dinucleotide biosynthesis protein A|nr:molybdenum cofactor guanylyltransferase [Bacillota bacterium]
MRRGVHHGAATQVDPTAIVLAGGAGSRIGCNKALLDLCGRPLLAWVLDSVSIVASHVVIVASGENEAKTLRQVAGRDPVIVMDVLTGIGPLAGLWAGLDAAPTDRCIVVGCDMPFLSAPLLSALASLDSTSEIVVPRWADTGELEPLCAAYSKTCVEPIRALVAAGKRDVRAVFGLVRTSYMDESVWRVYDPDALSFFNVNTEAELQAAQAIAGARLSGPPGKPGAAV